jgi:hypothetical protein
MPASLLPHPQLMLLRCYSGVVALLLIIPRCLSTAVADAAAAAVASFFSSHLYYKPSHLHLVVIA